LKRPLSVSFSPTPVPFHVLFFSNYPSLGDLFSLYVPNQVPPAGFFFYGWCRVVGESPTSPNTSAPFLEPELPFPSPGSFFFPPFLVLLPTRVWTLSPSSPWRRVDLPRLGRRPRFASPVPVILPALHSPTHGGASINRFDCASFLPPFPQFPIRPSAAP